MPSKQAKQRKQDRKRTNKDLKVGKTAKQRKQRLANKVKRDAIHAIDPDLKVTIIDGKSYIGDDVMIEIIVVDGKIKDVDDDIPIDGDTSFVEQFKEAESYKDDLTPYATGETVAVEPEPAGMWDKLKNKWEKV